MPRLTFSLNDKQAATIKSTLTRKRLSQKDLAHELHYSEPAVSTLLRGKSTIDPYRANILFDMLGRDPSLQFLIGFPGNLTQEEIKEIPKLNRAQLEYKEVPEIALLLATTKVLFENPNWSLRLRDLWLSRISWYNAKLWVQEQGLALPTCREWFKAKEYFKRENPEIAEDMLQDGLYEWTDSLIAFPNEYSRKYTSRLNPLPHIGYYPLLIQGSTIEKWRGGYIIDGGERTELPNFPDHDVKNEELMPIPKLGVDWTNNENIVLYSNANHSYHGGLRPVYCGRDGVWIIIGADKGPLHYPPEIGSRPVLNLNAATPYQLLKGREDSSGLTDREKRVLQLRYGIEDGRNRTLEETGKEFGITRERIRQIELRAIEKLRHPKSMVYSQ